MASATLTLCSTKSPPVLNFTSLKPLKVFNFRTPALLSEGRRPSGVAFNADDHKKRHNLSFSATSARRLGTHRKSISITSAATSPGGGSMSELDANVRKLLQAFLWIAEGVYVIWLFLLPYAPGDPVWAISSDTINSLIGLSLNFFFILPLLNSGLLLIAKGTVGYISRIIIFLSDSYIPDKAKMTTRNIRVVGIHLIEAPVLHPMSEGLFNFVIGWTLMFAPLLYTDKRRDRYKGSLDVLWGFQMFLTNTFLIPYMAIRLNEADGEYTPRKTSQLGSIMINGAPVVGLIGGLACLLSILWALYGRGDGNYGDLPERWEFLLSYLGSERLAYAFIWDICLYIIFQPWLIGDNLQNIQKDKIALVNFLRFVPVVGLIAYCLCLDAGDET